MKLACWLLIIFIVILVFILTLFFGPEKNISKGPFPPGPNIRISTTPFQAMASPVIAPATPTVHPEPSAKATLVASVTMEDVTITPTSSTPGASLLRVNISDALGDPIKKGSIIIQGKERIFYGGLLLCNDIPNGVCELAASADGYRSATETVDVSKTNEVTITLEYTSTHEVTVYTDEKQHNPCAGADVYLWKGPVPPRPVDMHVAALVEGTQMDDLNTITFVRDAAGIHTGTVQKKYKDHLYQGYSGGKIKPWLEDLISGVDLLNWMADGIFSMKKKSTIPGILTPFHRTCGCGMYYLWRNRRIPIHWRVS